MRDTIRKYSIGDSITKGGRKRGRKGSIQAVDVLVDVDRVLASNSDSFVGFDHYAILCFSNKEI